MTTLFAMGFRPFFLGATVLAIAVILLWGLILQGVIPPPSTLATPILWHAHEMVFGFALAVIAGFLLTAVRNWTGQETPTGKPLAALFLSWLLARVAVMASFWEPAWQWLGAAFDLAFVVALTVVITRPILAVKQWRQLPILAKLTLIGISSATAWSGALLGSVGITETAILSGFYLVLALVLTIARRVFPFFSRGAAGGELPNHNWADQLSLFGLLVFWIAELFSEGHAIGNLAALAVFIGNACRLIGWHYKAVWSSPLLWGLYGAMLLICGGFLMMALRGQLGVTHSLALHLLAVGGLGFITLSMMGRVSIGHTGRSISHPPRRLSFALILILLGALTRVLIPWWLPAETLWAISLSAFFWIFAFSLFLSAYSAMLINPRADGKPG